MKKNLGLLSLALLGCSLGGLLTFRLIGSQVDSKGVLREPFFLLPLSVLLAGAGAASGLAAIALPAVRSAPPAAAEPPAGTRPR